MPRFFLLLTLSVCFFSCNKNLNQENPFSENLTFTLDTVWVDSGDEFIFLNDGLSPSVLAPDKSYLMNFNQMQGYAERISLDELKLEKRIHFEKDGPDKIPSFISRFNLTTDEDFMMWSYQFYAIFDQDAKKVKDLGLEKIIESYLSGSDVNPLMLFEVEEQADRMVGFFIQGSDKSYCLLDIDLEKKEVKKTDLAELDKLQDFNVELLNNGRSMGTYRATVSAMSTTDKILVSNNSFNEILVFDIKADSTYVKNWDTPLLGAKKNYLPPKQVDGNSGEIEEIIKQSKSEITYGELIRDEVERRFFRFSSRNRYGEEKDEFGQYISSGSDVFISIFDEDLNLLAETPVPVLKAPPKRHFVKDGKVWIFENIGDELAFIRLGIM